MYEMFIQKKWFIEGVVLNDIKSYTVIKIFNTLFCFVDYGFNRSYAIVYTALVYFTLYLKVNFSLDSML